MSGITVNLGSLGSSASEFNFGGNESQRGDSIWVIAERNNKKRKVITRSKSDNQRMFTGC